jgi:hypothetical protein
MLFTQTHGNACKQQRAFYQTGSKPYRCLANHFFLTGALEHVPFFSRCGRSEGARAVMKEDFAGGKLPSGDFGENATWWWIEGLGFQLTCKFFFVMYWF